VTHATSLPSLIASWNQLELSEQDYAATHATSLPFLIAGWNQMELSEQDYAVTYATSLPRRCRWSEYTGLELMQLAVGFSKLRVPPPSSAWTDSLVAASQNAAAKGGLSDAQAGAIIQALSEMQVLQREPGQ